MSLHPLWHFDAEQGQALFEQAGGGVAQGKTGGSRGDFGFQNGARFEETVEGAREFVEVVREHVRAVVFEDLREDFAELQQFLREREFGGLRNLKSEL